MGFYIENKSYKQILNDYWSQKWCFIQKTRVINKYKMIIIRLLEPKMALNVENNSYKQVLNDYWSQKWRFIQKTTVKNKF